MENNYKFITIHTLVNIGDGKEGLFNDEGEFTGTANLARITETIMRFSYPFMTSVSKSLIDLSKERNKNYYRFGKKWDSIMDVYTFKFAVQTDVDIHKNIKDSLNNVPLVLSSNDISRFITSGDSKNCSIIENKIH